MNLNSSPSPFPIQQIAAHIDNNNDDQHHSYQSFGPVNHSSCRIFFNSNRDHMAYYDPHQIYQSREHQPEKNYDYDYDGSTYGIKNRSGESSGLKLSLWKKEDVDYEKSIDYPVKWMSSKTRLNRTAINATEKTKIEGDQYLKMQPYNNNNNNNNNSSSSMENDHLISSSSPIRVCADCSTTKTPLWRSGPKGPKSLCNACGIRQRKARRAVAAAAAAAAASAASGVVADPPTPPPAKMIKVQHKEKIGKNATNSSQVKKRCKTTPPVDAESSLTDESSNKKKKIGNKLEEFLINLSNNLSFHRMFPEDEKDAAILLMALSSGLVHG
ncbi:hypothetical protein ABFS83_12G121800 [Erythranthe nasuta]